MKLIRLTTTNPNSIFNVDFQDQIIIPPNSQIALQNLSIEAEDRIITIDASNSQINFQIGSGSQYETSIQLDSNTYDKTNYTALLSDITNKLNQAAEYVFNQTTRYLGIEWRASTNQENKVSIQYLRGANGEYRDDWRADATYVEATGGSVWSQESSQPNRTDNLACALFPYNISNGCGYISAQIYNLSRTSGGALSNGFIIGLSTTDLHDTPIDAFTDSMMTYAIHCTQDAGGKKYQIVKDGVFTTYGAITPSVSGAGDPTNDYIEVILTGGEVQFNVFQFATSPGPTTINEETHTAGQKLYPFIVFRGQANDASIDTIRLTPSPFSNIPTEDKTRGNQLHSPENPIGSSDDNFLEFTSITLANFLGFNNQRQPALGFIFQPTVEYLANNAFNTAMIADAFLVEMLNLSLDSYDGLKGQRKNLLAVVPTSDKEGVVLYEPSTLFFIDLDNKEGINLRNIKCRVVNTDYSPFKMKGTATLTILVS
jgi:hypothetical protein